MAEHNIFVKMTSDRNHLKLKEGNNDFDEAITHETIVNDGDTINLLVQENDTTLELWGLKEYSEEERPDDVHFIQNIEVGQDKKSISFQTSKGGTHGTLVDHYLIGFRSPGDAETTWEDPKLRMRGSAS